MITTSRLHLRKLNIKDWEFIIRLLNSPGWLQFIGDRKVKTRLDAENYLLNGPMKSYQTNGFGLLLVIEKATELPVGMCGLLKRDNLDLPDIGFAFLPEFNGKGYALEAAEAVIAYSSKEWNINKIAAITLPENTRSIALLEKLGMVFRKTIKTEDTKENLLLYST